ncbi:hypothetical protein HMI54_013704 [Coelomomyces lativittatus]|nr:hypothetical protein HMI54_013704 [Coelomomyces lativittatus]KAJ1499093.1 hypothetical protein HMI55_004582 [Coelomomyces lativittatus]KAJ1501153.1 hypothetical protein HMI56_003405 [Coelomomyces lativittatus]
MSMFIVLQLLCVPVFFSSYITADDEPLEVPSASVHPPNKNANHPSQNANKKKEEIVFTLFTSINPLPENWDSKLIPDETPINTQECQMTQVLYSFLGAILETRKEDDQFNALNYGARFELINKNISWMFLNEADFFSNNLGDDIQRNLLDAVQNFPPTDLESKISPALLKVRQFDNAATKNCKEETLVPSSDKKFTYFDYLVFHTLHFVEFQNIKEKWIESYKVCAKKSEKQLNCQLNVTYDDNRKYKNNLGVKNYVVMGDLYIFK